MAKWTQKYRRLFFEREMYSGCFSVRITLSWTERGRWWVNYSIYGGNDLGNRYLAADSHAIPDTIGDEQVAEAQQYALQSVRKRLETLSQELGQLIQAFNKAGANE